jgi:hypothetical protein
LSGPKIDLCLAAAGDAFEQDRRESPFAEGDRHLRVGLGLLGGEDALLERRWAKGAL